MNKTVIVILVVLVVGFIAYKFLPTAMRVATESQDRNIYGANGNVIGYFDANGVAHYYSK